MRKIQNTNNMIVKQKRSELKRHYTISIQNRGDGFEARMTLKVIGGAKNPRLSAYSGISKCDAVIKILSKIALRLSEYKKMNILKKEICVNIYDSIMISIQELSLTSNVDVMKLVTSIFQILTTSNNIDMPSTLFAHTNIKQTNNMSNLQSVEQRDVEFYKQNQIAPIIHKSLYDVALEWFKYKLSLTQKSEENPKPLSPKTVQGYNDIINNQIIPYFKDNKNISIITEQNLRECIMSFNGFRNRESAYIVLKMLFDFAREKNYVFYTPRIKKPQKPYTDKEETIIFIESDRQDLWLDNLERESSNASLLFETMLLTGIRPEEACGLKWCAIDETTNELVINNAYKDYPIYNEDCKIIGHTRGDGRLKTPQSYRRIPINPRLKKRLLEHKEKQKKLFKMYQKKWNENCYMFLNQYIRPYIPENLSDAMKSFITKYNLEYMTPYGLRHSFATFCSEEGMDCVVLMRLMGHSDFNTTQKYYIVVSSKRKKQAMQKVYKNVFENEYRKAS